MAFKLQEEFQKVYFGHVATSQRKFAAEVSVAHVTKSNPGQSNIVWTWADVQAVGFANVTESIEQTGFF